jgi:hypothetical protein
VATAYWYLYVRDADEEADPAVAADGESRFGSPARTTVR